MIQQFNTEKLRKGCMELGLDLDSEQQTNVLEHLALLTKWNKQLNLTAIDSAEHMISHHVLDSLSVVRYVKGQSIARYWERRRFPRDPSGNCRF